MWPRKIGAVLAFVFLLTLSLETSGAAPSPTDQVRETIDKVISLLKDQGLSRAERRGAITDAIRARFDFRAMSERTLAADWERANPEEQDRFQELFSQLLEKTYMGRIEAYRDEKVEYRRERQRGDKAMVETMVVTKSVEIPMDYKLLQKDGGWFVYDVVIEEVSLIRNYRTTYQEIVRKEGFQGLLKQMEAKIAEPSEPEAAKVSK